VRLIGPDGKQLGIVDLNEALATAKEHVLDLVEISADASPPVCRVMDYGKFLFEQGKRQKKKTKQIHIKELKMRPGTDIGDYQVKLRKAVEFLQNGDKVKFTVRFRGREMAYQRQGMDMLKRIEQDLLEQGSVEQMPKMEGRQMVMVVGQKRKQGNPVIASECKRARQSRMVRRLDCFALLTMTEEINVLQAMTMKNEL
jgi:translation initiation factor IF-3